MKAIVCEAFGAPNDVALVTEVALPPEPGMGEVAITVSHATVSHATDLLIRGRYQSQPPLPFTPGTELVGRVRALGPGVRGLALGDRVLGLSRWGCYAEHVNIAAHTVYPIESGLTMLDALPLPLSYGTAYTALVWKVGLQPSDTVLVLGAGSGVGLAAVDLASAMGARVIACASSEEKRARALAHGADLALAPDESMVQQIKAASPQGVSIIFDPVGGDLMEMAFKAAAQGAQIISIGFAAGRVPQLPLNIMLVKNLTLHGFFFGKYLGWTPVDERARFETDMRAMMRALMQLTRQGRIQPKITALYPMDQLCQAIDDLHQRRVQGKIALAITAQSLD